MRYWLAILLVLGVAGLARAQFPDLATVEIQAQKLADGIYMLTGAGGNMGVSVGDDGVFLVDDQFAALTPKIEAAIRKLSDKPIRFVLNTHLHHDHTGGNENLGKAGATIVGHHTVRERMSREQFNPYVDVRTPPHSHHAMPLLTYSEDMVFHVNGHDIRVHHIGPAHTDGDSLIHFRAANILHTGDVFVHSMYPFVDVTSGGSIDGILAFCDEVLALADDQTQIIPGHGPVSTRADVQAFRNVVQAARDRIAALLSQGKTLEETIAADPLAEYNAEWGDGFLPPERFITFVYLSLGGEGGS